MGEVDRWASLPSDLLNEIATFMYSYDDYVRLRSVCQSWSKLPKIPNYTRNPWLVFPFTGYSVEGEEGIYELRLPEISNHLIYGSCHGWLITLSISDGALQTLNPFTKVSYDLPPISTFPSVVTYQPENIGEEYTLLTDDLTTYTLERTHMHTTEVKKIIISSPPDGDFMAVVIYNETNRLAFYRTGASRWIEIPTGESGCPFLDVIFHDGKIYAVNTSGQLYEFDMHAKPSPLGGPSEAKPLIFKYNVGYVHLYLVGCPNGDLLMVERRRHFPLSPYRTIKFDIYVMTKSEPVWSKLDTLGDYALMIGFNSPVLLPPTSSDHNRRNCIYYTDNLTGSHSCLKNGVPCIDDPMGGEDIGVFDLEDKSNNQLFPNTTRLYPPPVWLC